MRVNHESTLMVGFDLKDVKKNAILLDLHGVLVENGLDLGSLSQTHFG